MAIGTGLTVWAQQFIPTNLVAMIVAFNPLMIILLLWLLFQQLPQPKALFGGAISIVGMGLLVGQPQLAGGGSDIYWGLAAIACAMSAWALGSIYMGRLDMGPYRLQATAIQMMGGGAVVLLFSWALGEPQALDWGQITARSLYSCLYLTVFGSILGYSCFNYLLLRVRPEKVATSTYVNPVVALVLGAWLNNEVISGQSILAGSIMLTGVYFITTSR
ncbi:MAG: EamA family transporter [Lewinella sp.]|nr:EamA family transporter [Lewinella sp.]